MEKNKALGTEEISEHIKGINLLAIDSGYFDVPKPDSGEKRFIEVFLPLNSEQKINFVKKSNLANLAKKFDNDPESLVSNYKVKAILRSYFPGDSIKLSIVLEDKKSSLHFTESNVRLSSADKAFLNDQLEKYIVKKMHYSSKEDYIATNSMNRFSVIDPGPTEVFASYNNLSVTTYHAPDYIYLRELLNRGNVIKQCNLPDVELSVLEDMGYDFRLHGKHTPKGSTFELDIVNGTFKKSIPIPMRKSEAERIREDAADSIGMDSLEKFWAKLQAKLSRPTDSKVVEVLNDIQPEHISKESINVSLNKIRSTAWISDENLRKLFSAVPEFSSDPDHYLELCSKIERPELEIVSHGKKDTVDVSIKYKYGFNEIRRENIHLASEQKSEMRSKVEKSLGTSVQNYLDHPFDCIVDDRLPPKVHRRVIYFDILVPDNLRSELCSSSEKLNLHNYQYRSFRASIKENNKVALYIDAKYSKDTPWHQFSVQLEKYQENAIRDAFIGKYGSIQEYIEKNNDKPKKEINSPKNGMGM